jgi:DtxR family manganese transport transcriptional regulator
VAASLTPPVPALPTESAQARRMNRARRDLSAIVLEDYTELIADLLAGESVARPTEIARRLGVSHATAINNVARLRREGLVVTRPYRGILLTEAGKALAERMHARHRLVVALLRALGVDEETAETDAEGIEHHLSPATEQAFARLLASLQR